MTTAPTETLTKDQLEKAILLEVVTRFMNLHQSTSRQSLVIKFDGQPTGHVLFELMTRTLLNRQQSCIPTESEKYLPGALAFEFCGNEQFRQDAKFAATIVLHALKEMYKNEKNEIGFSFEDLERYAAEKFPDRHIDSQTLKLGLYLSKNLSVLTSYGLLTALKLSSFGLRSG
jgi:hypothetical protein